MLQVSICTLSHVRIAARSKGAGCTIEVEFGMGRQIGACHRFACLVYIECGMCCEQQVPGRVILRTSPSPFSRPLPLILMSTAHRRQAVKQ